MTWDFFEAQMARLRGLRWPPGDLQTHWDGLRELPEAVLEAAVARATKTRVDFPTPHEVREDADIVAHLVTREPDEDRGEDLPEPVELGTLPDGTKIPPARRLWRFYCETCADTGLRSWWCGEVASARYPWMPVRRCDMTGCRKTQYDHEFVERCACYDTNPALVKQRERQRRYAEAKSKRAA